MMNSIKERVSFSFGFFENSYHLNLLKSLMLKKYLCYSTNSNWFVYILGVQR